MKHRQIRWRQVRNFFPQEQFNDPSFPVQKIEDSNFPNIEKDGIGYLFREPCVSLARQQVRASLNLIYAYELANKKEPSD